LERDDNGVGLGGAQRQARPPMTKQNGTFAALRMNRTCGADAA
jgi:hypothetical protein